MPDSAGLVLAGLQLTYTGPWLSAQLMGASIESTRPSVVTQGRRFGFEANLLLDVALYRDLSGSLDAGIFVPGDYYGSLPTGFQLILGLTLKAESLFASMLAA